MPEPTELLNFYADLAGLYDYWDRKRAGCRMPPWHKFDAVEMKPWLGRLNVVDVEKQAGPDGGDAFRYRIFGTEIAVILDCEMTGRYVGDGDAGAGQVLLEGYRKVVSHRAPVLRRQDPAEGTRLLRHARLMLPISEDGRSVSKVLVGIHPLWRRRYPTLLAPAVHDDAGDAGRTDARAGSADRLFGADSLRLVV